MVSVTVRLVPFQPCFLVLLVRGKLLALWLLARIVLLVDRLLRVANLAVVPVPGDPCFLVVLVCLEVLALRLVHPHGERRGNVLSS
ncbi:hypothetical protein C8Q72DRAFT_836897 [Fomitopsis betulina]|nr:hypothetical protein C8Q72DRAFT_836897 [Fomitopsis betulina]